MTVTDGKRSAETLVLGRDNVTVSITISVPHQALANI